MLNFTIASNDRKLNQQTGNWDDVPNFIDCTMFGNRAEKIEKYLTKGTKVCIDGKLRWSKFETRDGNTREKLEVVIDELDLLSQTQSDKGGGSHGAESRASASTSSWLSSDGISDDEIPF